MSVNEFKLPCESIITRRDNELGLKSGQEKEITASFSMSFASTKLTKEPAIVDKQIVEFKTFFPARIPASFANKATGASLQSLSRTASLPWLRPCQMASNLRIWTGSFAPRFWHSTHLLFFLSSARDGENSFPPQLRFSRASLTGSKQTPFGQK